MAQKPRTKEYHIGPTIPTPDIVDSPGFPIRSVRVDNLTIHWLRLEAGGQMRRIPPGIVNYTTPLSSNLIKLHLADDPGLAAGTNTNIIDCTVIVSSDRSMVGGSSGISAG